MATIVQILSMVGLTWALLSVPVTTKSQRKLSSWPIAVSDLFCDRGGQPEARAHVEGPQVIYICIKRLKIPPQQSSLILLYVSQHRSLTAIDQKKASSHSLVFTRDTRKRDREKSSGQTDPTAQYLNNRRHEPQVDPKSSWAYCAVFL